MARGVNQLLGRVFAQRRHSGRTDLEALETALRTMLHQAGSAALSELLQYEAPPQDQRQLPCPCGHHAQYQGLRAKPLLTALGPAQICRPYYLCSQCHQGQFPADAELDIVNTEVSPCVRRMSAVVGAAAPFDHGREQIKILAGLEITTKAVERTAEAIGGDIARGERQEIQQAVQLDLPILVGKPIPILYVQMDGTGVPVVKKETVGRQGKTDGQPAHTREVKLGCVFTQTSWDKDGYAIRDPDSTTYAGAIETAEEFGSFQLHLEWQAPEAEEENMMNRGNNGVFLMGLFEIQIFDPRTKIYPDGQAASIYGQTPPLVNACRRPPEWETYDIVFSAPAFKGDKLEEPPRVTMLQNGVLVHHAQEIYGGTGHRMLPRPLPVGKTRGPLALGAHQCPVRFRNIWLRPLGN